MASGSSPLLAFTASVFRRLRREETGGGEVGHPATHAISPKNGKDEKGGSGKEIYAIPFKPPLLRPSTGGISGCWRYMRTLPHCPIRGVKLAFFHI